MAQPLASAVALAADALAAAAAGAGVCTALRVSGARRTRAALREAGRSCRARTFAAAVLPVAAVVVLLGLTADSSRVSAIALGGACGPATLGLAALAGGGCLERRGRSAAARRLSRSAVPWIAVGSLLAVATAGAIGLELGAPLWGRTAPLAAGSVLLLASGAVGCLGGLARKPRPSAGIALTLHALGVGLAATALGA